MADSGGDLVANFMAITGAEDAVAIEMLEAANFSLELAVQLFFAADGNISGDQGGDTAAGKNASAGAHGGAGQSSAAAPAHRVEEDDVRAPLPTKIERLYGDDFDPRAMYQYHGLSGRQQQTAHIDVFRDFRAETAAAATAAQPPGATGSTPGPPAAQGGSAQGLSGLFKLPADLVFSGNADLAKARAAAEGKWLLFNVQSTTEFASHRLNRDTWSHEALKEVLKGTFVFYQTHESSPDGRALIKAYKLDASSSPCPAILIVDPLTGAKMWHRAGFIDAEKLMEELVPFLDHGPMDSGAANLAQNNHMRKTSAAKDVTPGPAGPTGLGVGTMTEDEELALAIAMSMEGAGAAGGGVGSAPRGEADQAVDTLDDLDEAAIWERIQAAEQEAAGRGAAAETRAAGGPKTPEVVAAEALARVPTEPQEGDPEAVRVALRMPDGTRITRRFRRTDPVRVLFDYSVAHVSEAAAGRSLVIAHAAPGGQMLSDRDQSLDAAGVAGAMLAVKLAD